MWTSHLIVERTSQHPSSTIRSSVPSALVPSSRPAVSRASRSISRLAQVSILLVALIDILTTSPSGAVFSVIDSMATGLLGLLVAARNPLEAARMTNDVMAFFRRHVGTRTAAMVQAVERGEDDGLAGFVSLGDGIKHLANTLESIAKKKEDEYLAKAGRSF